MGDSLPQLEAERSQILQQFTTLGDLRPGSICAVARRCGKPSLGDAVLRDFSAVSPRSVDPSLTRGLTLRVIR